MAQWAWNAALTANPIGLIIVAIVAVIAAIVMLVKHWDTIKAKFEGRPNVGKSCNDAVYYGSWPAFNDCKYH